MNKIETAKIVTIVAAIAAVGAMTMLASMSLVQQADAKQTKVLVWHSPPDNPANGHFICVPLPAAFDHIEEHPNDEFTRKKC